MAMNRRNFIKTVGTGLAAVNCGGVMNAKSTAVPGAGGAGNEVVEMGAAGISMCDWNLGKMCDPDLISKAKEAHLQGIQVSLGIEPESIPLRSPDMREKYLALGKEHGITFNSVAIGMLNKYPLATEPMSAVFVIDALETATVLGAKNILLAFFGNGDLRKRNDEDEYNDEKDGKFSSFELDAGNVQRVVDTLKQIVPRAEDAGVVIGLENTIAAKQNLEIIDTIGSEWVQVYYDIGNSTGSGYDCPSELRLIGNDRLCEVHLKDWKTRMLGDEDAQVDNEACAKALEDIGYNKWLVLETSGRKGKFVEDTRTNVEWAKKTFKMA